MHSQKDVKSPFFESIFQIIVYDVYVVWLFRLAIMIANLMDALTESAFLASECS
jgi:NADH:ubiquinone oxidoreductase subunit 6 (subunit J)